jgi:hypothetical protein
MLALGTYQTRNGRKVILTGQEDREVTLLTGVKRTMTFYQGTLYNGDGRTPDSTYEWVVSEVPKTLGEFVQPHNRLPAGQTTMKDLVVFVSAQAA